MTVNAGRAYYCVFRWRVYPMHVDYIKVQMVKVSNENIGNACKAASSIHAARMKTLSKSDGVWLNLHQCPENIIQSPATRIYVLMH